MNITQSCAIQCNTIKIPHALFPTTTPIPPQASSSAQAVAPFPSGYSILSIKQCPARAHHGVCGVQNLQRKERAHPTPHSSFINLKGSRQHLFYHCRYCNVTGCGCYFSGTESLMSCLCFPHRAGKAVPDCKPPLLSNAQQPHYSSII